MFKKDTLLGEFQITVNNNVVKGDWNWLGILYTLKKQIKLGQHETQQVNKSQTFWWKCCTKR